VRNNDRDIPPPASNYSARTRHDADEILDTRVRLEAGATNLTRLNAPLPLDFPQRNGCEMPRSRPRLLLLLLWRHPPPLLTRTGASATGSRRLGQPTRAHHLPPLRLAARALWPAASRAISSCPTTTIAAKMTMRKHPHCLAHSAIPYPVHRALSSSAVSGATIPEYEPTGTTTAAQLSTTIAAVPTRILLPAPATAVYVLHFISNRSAFHVLYFSDLPIRPCLSAEITV